MERFDDYDITACLEYNPQPDFKLEDIAEVLAVWEGENEGDNWRWIFKLTDGRCAFMKGGCDYTGWDCISWADSEVYLSDIQAVPTVGDEPDEVHKELVEQLVFGKNKTWREGKDEEIGKPPTIEL